MARIGADGNGRAVSGAMGAESVGVSGGAVEGGDEDVLVRLLELLEPGTGVDLLKANQLLQRRTL